MKAHYSQTPNLYFCFHYHNFILNENPPHISLLVLG